MGLATIVTKLKKIKKRDGTIVDFNQEKVTNAIFRAAQAVAIQEGKTADRNPAERISDRIVGTLEHMYADTIPTVEQIQDVVERTLISTDHGKTAKAFILYREQHKKLREARRQGLDIKRMINSFVDGTSWLSRENANSAGITASSLYSRIAGDNLKAYAFSEIYPPEIADAHDKGQMHIHDLDYAIVPYCAGWSLEQLIKIGFGKVKGKIHSRPAKHLDALVLQMINFIGTMQGEFAGAQAFSSVDTLLAAFVKANGMSYRQVSQDLQKLLYGLNVNSRWGGQAPFSNMTFDLTAPKDMKSKRAVVGGQEMGFTYGECQKEMDMINMALLEELEKGDAEGRPFGFPIPTYNIGPDFDWDSDIANKLFEVTGKYGYPYFLNYVGTGRSMDEIRAMCCRINIDQKELLKRPGGMWGIGDSTGSIGVVTMNMNRIGYEADGNKDKFFKLLGERMDLAYGALEKKRSIITDLMQREPSFIPYTKAYLGHFMNHFSTIGLCGMNEACLSMYGEDIRSKRGKQLALESLLFMGERAKEYQQESGNLYNIEATPAESTAYRFALKDREMYPNIAVSGDGVPFLTNSTHLPVDATRDVFEAIEHQEDLQALYTGGTIFHVFLPEKISGDVAKGLAKRIVQTKIPYFSYTPTYSICEDHGYLKGEQWKCSSCGKDTEVYSRIVGYIRPVQNWNAGKQEEFKHRVTYDVK